MSCPGCGEYFNEFDREPTFVRELDITVCKACAKKIEEKHKINGKYVVLRCKECGCIQKIVYEKYKKRGRTPGSKNKPKPGEPRQLVLGTERQTVITA